MMQSRQIGQILLELGYITQSQLVDAVMEQKRTGGRIGEVLLRRGHIDIEQLTEALALQTGLDYVRFNLEEVQSEAVALIPGSIVRQWKIMPVRVEDGQVVFATESVDIIDARPYLREAVPVPHKLALANPERVRSAIGFFYAETDEELCTAAQEPYVQAFLTKVFTQALEKSASAIHLEMEDQHLYRLCYRVGRKLQIDSSIPKALAKACLTRLRGLSQQQEGFAYTVQGEFTLPTGTLAFQVSVLNTCGGERAVIHLLDAEEETVTFDKAGVSADSEQRLRTLLQSEGGLFLVASATEPCAKKVVYPLLIALRQQGRNIFSLEQFVERQLSGIHQVCLRQLGMSSAASLLHLLLRQDPDVLYVSDVSDEETAYLCMQMAIKGRWVIAFVRAHTAGEAMAEFSRFRSTHLLLNVVLQSIVAVREAPATCPSCREPHPPTEKEATQLALHEGELVFHGKGCEYCAGTGYRGTTAVNELLIVDQMLREAIASGGSPADWQAIAAEAVKQSLVFELREKVRSGSITARDATLFLSQKQFEAPSTKFKAA